MSKVLFIVKKRQTEYGVSFGLLNSCRFLHNALQQIGIDSKVVEVVDNNCIHASTKVTTEDGIKTIKWIVDNRYSGKVMSFSEKNGQFEWNTVTNWWSRSNAKMKKAWINIQTKPKSKLICTEDHKCAIIDDPLRPIIYYLEAKDTVGKYILKKSRKNDNFDVNPLFNQRQLSVMLGSLMGDGHISQRNCFSCGHSVKQIDYLKFKHNILGGLISKKYKNEWGTTISFTAPVNAQTQYLRQLVYPNGKKNITELLKYLDEISLAFWYMDDGCLVDCSYKKSRPHIRLATHSYTHEEHLLMIKWFSEKWGIAPVISTQKQNGKEYEFLEFHKDDSEIFWKLIAQYIPVSMEYKIPEKFRKIEKYQFNNTPLGYAATKIINIAKNDYNQNSKLYDIEVENVHNFVANEVLVHNCIDREVHQFKPTHVFIEALWVVPEKFKVLIPLHPTVKWYIRLHSNTPFLANEGIAMQWINGYEEIRKEYKNLWIAPNAEKLCNDLIQSRRIPVKYAPNVYCPDKAQKVSYTQTPVDHGKNIINISCFGAIRPMKNHLIQAMAAMTFADQLGKTLHFHVNGRCEQNGENGYRNLVSLFAPTKHKIINHPWCEHSEFMDLVRQMDLGLQVSFSETFNIVAADMTTACVPVIGSSEISWLSMFFKSNPTDLNEIVAFLTLAYYGKKIHLHKLNEIRLKSYNRKALNAWEKLLKEK